MLSDAARELAESFPIVSATTDALTAARTMGDERHPRLIDGDGDGDRTRCCPAPRC